MHRYELSRAAELPPLCPCQMGYATQPTGLCKTCLDIDAARCDAALRDLESARHAANHGTVTPQQAFEAFIVAVLVIGIVAMFIAILWLRHMAFEKGRAMATYGAQGWEGHK